jgi:uncharacterized protein Smg (DUF494 family)
MENMLLDIVIYLAEKAQSDSAILVNPKNAREVLVKAGFPPEDVENAIGWAKERLAGKKINSIRILSPYERAQLTTDGCGLLIRLRNLGLLTDEHLELIIARSILLGEGRMNADDIRAFATAFLFDLRNQNNAFSIYIDSNTGDKAN